METNVGSPPMVRRTSRAARSRIDSVAKLLDGPPVLFGVGLGDSRRFPDRVSDISMGEFHFAFSTSPLIGAADAGSGVQESGM